MVALNPEAYRICIWMYLAFVIVWMAAAMGTKPTQWRVNTGSRLLYFVPTVLAFLLVFSHAWEYPWLQYPLFSSAPGLSVAGVVLTAAGLCVAVWARLHIRGNWSGGVTLKAGHQLVRSGPYRFVRHPIYSGLLLAVFGTALTNLRVRFVLGLVCLWVGFLFKSRIEENLMQRTFGPEYMAYKDRTGALLPKL